MNISICGSPPIFLDNKYTKFYLQLVERGLRRKTASYVESHHIWPKCLGGPSKTEHLVNLTFREHFIAHHLLTKMTEGADKRNAYWALSWFQVNHDHPDRKLTARQYEIARKALRVLIPFYFLNGDEYSLQPDFYRFCDEHGIGRANVQAKLKKNGVHVISAGKHKGKCFSLVDVGPEMMKKHREHAFELAYKNRSTAIA